MATARSGAVRFSFTSGEFSPRMDARIDFERASSACRILRNLRLKTTGAATRRRGLQFIAATKNGALP